MPSPILARADALMQRRHQTGSGHEDIPVLTDALDADDIPILLDAEPPQTGLPPDASCLPEAAAIEPLIAALAPDEIAPSESPAAQPGQTPDYEPLVAALADRVRQRLQDEIPRLIESTVHDFLAEQAMIDRHGND